MGIGFIIPGTGPGTGPILPPPLHGYGRTDASHRWVAGQLSVADGSPLTSWTDIITGKAATNSGSHLTTATVSGIGKVVRAPGVAGGDAAQYLTTGSTIADVKTVVIIYGSVSAPTGGGAYFTSAESKLFIGRAGNGQVQVSAPSTSAGSTGYALADNSAGTTGWHFIAGTADGATTATATFDGATSSAAYSPGSGGGSGTTLFGAASGVTDRQIAEILTFPTVLSASDLAPVRAALKTFYTALS